MTEDRDFKRRVRARMEKTGEAYTTARTRLLAKSQETFRVDDMDIGAAPAPSAVTAPSPPSVPPVPPPPLLPPDHEALTGVSDRALQAATGHGWVHWTRLLDTHGARALPHPQIARHLRDGEGVDAWWAQSIAVGYERLRGLRAPGQHGSWQVGGSRTLPVSVERLFDALHEPSQRDRWLGVEGLTLRSARPGKVVRLVWPDGSVAEAGFTRKGGDRSTVTVQHRKLPDGETAAAVKVAWEEALDRLAAWLEPETASSD